MTSTQVPRASPPEASGGQVKGMARGGVANLVGSLLSGVATFGSGVAITRGFSLTQAGAFFSITSVFLVLATLCRLGTTTGVVYFVARLVARGRNDAVAAVMRKAINPAIGLGVLAAALCVLAGLTLPHALGLGHQTRLTLIVLSPFLPFAVVNDILLSGTQGFGSMRSTVMVDRIARTAVQFVLVVAAAFGTHSLLVTSVAWAAPYVFSSLWAKRELTRMIGRRRAPIPASLADRDADDPAGPASWGELIRPAEYVGPVSNRRFWGFTAPRSISSVVQIVVQRADVLMIAGFLGAGPAAIYSAATRFLVIGQLTNQAVSLAAAPRLGTALARGDKRGANQIYQVATAWLILLAWPLYLVILQLTTLLLHVFGPRYLRGESVTQVLMAATMFAAACGMVDRVLAMAGRTSWNLYNNLFTVVINIGLNLVLIPRMGIVGAAISWAAAIVFNNVVPLTQVFLAERLHPVSRGSVTAIGLSLVCFGLLPEAVRLLGGGDVAVLAACVAAVLPYAAACFVLRRSLNLTELIAGLKERGGGRSKVVAA
jgi:O-antigen/teichoic acid export membrane protein